LTSKYTLRSKHYHLSSLLTDKHRRYFTSIL